MVVGFSVVVGQDMLVVEAWVCVVVEALLGVVVEALLGVVEALLGGVGYKVAVGHWVVAVGYVVVVVQPALGLVLGC